MPRSFSERYIASRDDPEAYWRVEAEQLPWLSPPSAIVDERSDGLADYFSDGTTNTCLLYTSPSPRDYAASRMPSSA